MNMSWKGNAELIEAQDKRIAQLKAENERLRKQLDFALKDGDTRWHKEHAKLNDLWGAEDGEYVCIAEYSGADSFATLREAEENAAYCQRNHECCAIVKLISIAEVNEYEDEPEDDPRDYKADQIQYDEPWKYAAV